MEEEITEMEAVEGAVPSQEGAAINKKLTENFVVDNSKIKKAMGIEKMRVSSEIGMYKTLLSFKDL